MANPPATLTLTPLGNSVKSFGQSAASAAVFAVILGGMLIGYDHYFRDKATPIVNPVSVAAKDYIKTLPDVYHLTSEQVKKGEITDKQGIVKALVAHSKPLVDATDAAILPLIDPATGKLTNSVSAANMLEEVSKALGGKQ